jgi:transposase
MAIVTVGIDLAKNVFALHGVNETGVVQLRQPKVGRGKLNELAAALPQRAETTAAAIVAMVGNGAEFSSGRQFAAWLGLVPGQYSSGGKTRLGRNTQGRRRLPAQPAGAWCSSDAQRRRGQDRLLEPMGDGAARAARLLEGGGGDCGEARAHGLGSAHQGRALQAAGLRGAAMNIEYATPRRMLHQATAPP